MGSTSDTVPAMADRKRQTAPPREKPQQIADELRALIVGGELSEGDSLGHEPELVERFGVSRPSLREALRILEAEGLITVVRGVLGGVVVHEPDERMTARAAALVLQARNVPLADVYDARSLIEPTAARIVATSRSRRSAAAELRGLIDEQERAIEDPEAFGRRERPLPRRARRAGRESDAAHRRGDAERDRGSGSDRGRAIRRREGQHLDAPPRHPISAATGGADRGRQRAGCGGALAVAHGRGRQGHAGPERDDCHRSLRPLLDGDDADRDRGTRA